MYPKTQATKKRKPIYKIWRWKRCVLEGNTFGFYLLPLIGFSRESGQWSVWVGWLTWLFTLDLTGGYTFNYLKYDE